MSCYILCGVCVCANGVQSVKTSSSRRQTCPNQSNYQTKIAHRKNAFGISLFLYVCVLCARIQSKFLWIKFGLVFFWWTNGRSMVGMCSDDTEWDGIFHQQHQFFLLLATDEKWTNFTAANFELPTNQIKSARRHTLTLSERGKKYSNFCIFIYSFLIKNYVYLLR